MRILGIEVDVIEDDDGADRMFPVYPDNWDAVMLFLRLRTQWRSGAMGGVLGLDYTAVAAVFNILRVPDRETLFSHLQEMESAALEVFGSRNKQ